MTPDLDALYAAAYGGTWRRGTPKFATMPAYVCTDDAQIAEVLIFDQMILTAKECRRISHATADWIIAIHNAYPDLRRRLEEAETSMTEVDRLSTALHRAMFALHQADPTTAMKLELELLKETVVPSQP